LTGQQPIDFPASFSRSAPGEAGFHFETINLMFFLSFCAQLVYDWAMKTLVLIDSNAIIHRAYHALPKNMSTSKGVLTNAVYGYATTLIKVLEDLKPDYMAASFDLAGPTFRHKEFAQYKATRVKADQELYDQIPLVRDLLTALDIPVYEKEGYEADDCIGTISDKFEERNPEQIFKDFQVYIVTGDKDTFQLVDGNIFVYNLKGGLSHIQIVDRVVIEKDWQLEPEDFIDLKALAGDPSDNIPGVPGIGPKTAIILLQKFDTLKKLYERIESEGKETIMSKYGIKERIVNLLIEHKEQAFLSQKLATICRDVPLNIRLEDMKWGTYDKDKLKEFFEQMQFHSLLRRFGVERMNKPKTEEAVKQKEKDEQLKLL
jgi:DNA polymerase I